MHDLDIPAFLLIPQAERNAAWAKNPPKAAVFLDPKLEADKARRVEAKKAETAARIGRMKTSLAQRPAKVDTTGMRWNTNRSRWEPDTQETELMNDQVQKYNEIAAAAGLPTLTIKKFENRAIGAQRIEKLQKKVDGSKEVVQSTVTEATAPGATEELPDMAKKAKAKTNGTGGKKNQLILDLLQRKSGATVEEGCKATGWKTVHYSAHAAKAGLKLRREKQKDGTSRYWAS